MAKRLALVTGASRGIGLELCKQLVARGQPLIATCRRATPELKALDVRVETDVDVASASSIAALAQRLADVKLNLLICNAGILHRESLDHMSFESMREQFEVNALGPLRVIQALHEQLGGGSKIALITSRMGSIADNSSGGRYGYRMSKAALNMAGVSLAHDLAPRGVAVAVVHPGYVRTGMTDFEGNIDADEAARGILERIDDLTLDTSGGFWHANGERLPW